MKDIFTIFKREKPAPAMPEPMFEDNWRQDNFDRNVKAGIHAMVRGKAVSIINDGRAYETALAIKRGFILEYQKQLADRIEIIHGGGMVYIKMIPKP